MAHRHTPPERNWGRSVSKTEEVRQILQHLSDINHGVLGLAELLDDGEYDRLACMLRVLAMNTDEQLGLLGCLWEEE